VVKYGIKTILGTDSKNDLWIVNNEEWIVKSTKTFQVFEGGKDARIIACFRTYFVG